MVILQKWRYATIMRLRFWRNPVSRWYKKALYCMDPSSLDNSMIKSLTYFENGFSSIFIFLEFWPRVGIFTGIYWLTGRVPTISWNFDGPFPALTYCVILIKKEREYVCDALLPMGQWVSALIISRKKFADRATRLIFHPYSNAVTID